MYKKYQVLFLGNGLNRSFAGDSWNDALNSISVRTDIPENLDCPMPLKAILCTNDNLSGALTGKRDLLYGRVVNDEQRSALQNILTAGFDDILTTNYSYELEIAALGKSGVTKNQLDKMASHTSAVERVEPKYLLHSYNQMKVGGITNHIWHIHGEAKKPDSIILGHYYYANLLGRMTQYSDETSNQYERSHASARVLEKKSWLDSFILGDVYILGFSFHLSEFDLWWLLNRKKREKAPHGKVYFFEPKSDGFDARIELLKLLDVECCDCGISKPKDNDKSKVNQIYQDFYSKAFDKILELKAANEMS